jgi:hypothetical protein
MVAEVIEKVESPVKDALLQIADVVQPATSFLICLPRRTG